MALLIVVGVCIVGHEAAVDHLRFLGTPLPPLKPTAAARFQFITYIDAHTVIVLPYLMVCIATLLWLQVRKSPEWCLFITFGLLVLPLFGYAWICLRAAMTAG